MTSLNLQQMWMNIAATLIPNIWVASLLHSQEIFLNICLK